ncbi:MaoC/PaaZ C-terminal domain-containing protein [Salinigranum halophilum]|jgi:acyl dehydratase|uniref:MaoC/PaaZ C-terminal domain-containing protein n=1 Tax=Salinigranum halophilum TaxID=2565931 RepID=UPI00115C63E4|nr:MaoC/PaaZ C-terminal domain-containing protein [Salinigranum halophilum]
MSPPEAGDVHVVERTFDREEVCEFAALSRDTQAIHTDRDPPMVHGLLTATLSTEIGGELAVLARTMTFEFLTPVYAGDTVRCEWTTERVETRTDRYDLTATVECRRTASAWADAEERVVLRGEIAGLVWRSDTDTDG